MWNKEEFVVPKFANTTEFNEGRLISGWHNIITNYNFMNTLFSCFNNPALVLELHTQARSSSKTEKGGA
jgi:hypothetical protein